MAGPTYVTKGYSTYTDFPTQEGGYDHGPNQPVICYVVETTTIERVRTPAVGYTNFGGSPSIGELLKEYIHPPNMLVRPKYAPKDHHEGYEPNHGSDYENSSPPRYYGRENFMDEFLNKLQIEASRPAKSSNFSSSNKHRPTSPEYSHPSEQAHLTRTRGLAGPNKYHPSSLGSEGDRHVRFRDFSGPNNQGPPVTRHPLTTSTNDVNEALNFQEETMNYSPRSGRKIKGGEGDKSMEPERRYGRPAFVTETTEPHILANTIDSQMAVKKYRGAHVP